MTTHDPLPVKGYSSQSPGKIDRVNQHKEIEERVLRLLDTLHADVPDCDVRWLAIARTNIEQGFMALNRSVFKPGRIALPEDRGV